MQERSIINALLQVRFEIVRGKLDGLEHVNALLLARGYDPSSQHIPRQIAPNTFKRRALRTLIIEGLHTGPMRGRDVAAYVAAREPSVTQKQAMRRVYQGLTRLKACGMVLNDGRKWHLTLQ